MGSFVIRDVVTHVVIIAFSSFSFYLPMLSGNEDRKINYSMTYNVIECNLLVKEKLNRHSKCPFNTIVRLDYTVI